MKPFTQHVGRVALMDRSDVDTDQIIPKQFLKRIERTGFEDFLFFDWRFLEDGSPDPAFELNQPRFAGATILAARQNFGCGSSREHAVWALENFGFRVVVAGSFADIFYNNCFKNGVLPVALPEAQLDALFGLVEADPQLELTVDLERRELSAGQWRAGFEVDDFRRQCLLKGLDDIALTLRHEAKIAAYEQR